MKRDPFASDGAPRRVLFVAPEARFFVTHRLPLAVGVRDAGYEVSIATPDGPGVDAIRKVGLRWHDILLRRSSRNPFVEMFSAPDLIRLYRRVRPELVHHIGIKAILYGTIAARAARVPAVVNAVAGLGTAFGAKRSIAGRAVSAAYAVVLRRANLRVIFQNVEDRDLFLRRGWIRPEQAVIIRGSGVDPDEYYPGALPLDPPLVLFASRLLASKGVREFVEMAGRLRDSGSRARFAIAGDVDPASFETIRRDELDRWAAEGVIEVWGRRNDMADVLRRTTIFCLPTYYPEGLPKVLIEAAASGVPAVTTDVPGCRDIVVDGETGMLVPPRDIGSLVTAVAKLLDDRGLRSCMAERARQRAVSEFTISHVIAATVRVYEQMLPPGASVRA